VDRGEALRRLEDPRAEIDYEELDAIFRAFGFRSDSPNFETEVYYHPQWRHECGPYVARDDGLHVLSPEQRERVRAKIGCVLYCEQAYKKGK
jgi:hypothetical protein